MALGPASYSEDRDAAAVARERLDEAAEMAAVFAESQRQLVAKLIELWPTAAWLASGCRSAKQWLLAYTTVSVPEALCLEQVAELCATHPRLADAVVSGELPMRRATTLGRTVTPERARYLDEIVPELLKLNRDSANDDSFATAVRFWAEQVDQELEPRRQPLHSLAATPALFGGGTIIAHLSPAAYQTVVAAIDGFTQEPDPAHAPYRRSFRERRADALDDLAAAALTGLADPLDDEPADPDDDTDWEDLHASDVWDGTADGDELDEVLAAADAGEDITGLDALRRRLRAMEEHRRRRTRRRTRIRSAATINATIDVRTLLGLRDRTDLHGLVMRGDGWHLTRTVLEQLLCDSGLLATLFDGPTRILDANARAEQFTKAQRRALAARDGCCTFPGCTRPPRHCDAHHLHHRNDGGPSTTDNAALLCRFHHRLLHQHGWRLQIHDHHWTAIDPHGHTWTGRPAPPHLATAA